jgi:hypothetical protein
MSAATNAQRSPFGLDIKALRIELEANRALLDRCAQHDFNLPIDRHTKQPIPEWVFGCYWKCSVCGGWVDTTARNWYAKGVQHVENRIAGAVV